MIQFILSIHLILLSFFFFFFNDTATTEIYTLSHTTLFRSPCRASRRSPSPPAPPAPISTRTATPSPWMAARSEEHTSELQSQSNLVCRLLLEKKNKQDAHTAQTL